MNSRLAFFDIDGVLSAPRYPDGNGNFGIGFTEEEWPAYCEQAGADGYQYCLPVPCVKDYARSLKEEGCLLFVLSTVGSDAESAAKEKFVRTQYPDFFQELLFVKHDAEKIPLIERYAKEYAVPLSACVLVEDTYPTLLKAHNLGIKSLHIANLAAGMDLSFPLFL